MSRLVTICALIFIVNCLYSQSRYTSYKQYTIDDGLPSNECHGVLQDSLGYIWIATDRGLSRFDGKEFKTYGIKEGLKELSCLDVQMDNRGDLWMYTYSHNLYKYLPRLDTVVAYKYNSILQSEMDDSGILDFLVHADTVYVSMLHKGYLKISKTGTFVSYQENDNKWYVSFIELGDDILCYDRYDLKNRYQEDKFVFESGVHTGLNSFYLNGEMLECRYRPNQKKYFECKAFKSPENTVLFYYSGFIYECSSDGVVDVFESDGIKDLLILDDGAIITGHLEGGGIVYYQNLNDLRQNKGRILYSDISVTSLALDRDNNVIASTLDQGLFLFKKPEIVGLSSSLISGQDIRNIQRSTSSTCNLILNVNMADVLEYNFSKNTIVNKDKGLTKRLFHIYVNPRTGQRIYSAYPISFNVIDNNEFISKVNSGFSELIQAKAARGLPNEQTLVLSTAGIAVFEDGERYPSYYSYPEIIRLNAIDALDYKDGYLIGGRDGLYYLSGSAKSKLDSIHPFFEYRINSIERIDTTYYMGSLGGGLAIWDGHNDVTVIDEEDGLISNNIEKVITDSMNTVVLCTKYGISKISIQDSVMIENYTMSHGLPSNQVNDAMFINDTLFIATTRGLAYLPPKLMTPLLPKMPLIERVSVNSMESELVDSLDLEYNENAISITFKALDYSQVNQIQYRYRLNQSPWIETTDTEVNFAALEPDGYQFEVCSSNKDGDWSPSSIMVFTISPPWWKTKLFWGSLLLGIGFIGYYVYRRRVKVIEDKNALEREVLKLERSALQAQMNPHFIFNCLSSIQSFIIANDKEMAMDYLSTFAKLIRQNLNASATNTISLHEEIAMLSNYLQLEQLRCNHSFEYEIQLPNDIDPISISFPPLLIQPYVENAIIHGMKSRTANGLIEVSFDLCKHNTLSVVVKDNGSGMQVNSSRENQSLGMKLTQRRLALNNLQSDSHNIQTTTGQKGTEIKIEIRLV